MALTYAIKKKSVAGNSRRHLVDVTIGVAGDYSSGLSITALGCGLSRIDVLNPVGATLGATILFDPTTSKLRMYKSSASLGLHTEVAGADVAAAVVRVEAIEYQNT